MIRKAKILARKFAAFMMARSHDPGTVATALDLCRRSLDGGHLTLEQQRYADFLHYTIENLGSSKAQLFQDMFAASIGRGKRDGFFVEFGAADGIAHSNTYFLEKTLGWRGILAEPCRGWHEALRKNRNAVIDTRCVLGPGGKKVAFEENQEREVSGVASLHAKDAWSDARKSQASERYMVETISLAELLKEQHAPHKIDYISIDTEGSELEILRAFDFREFDVTVFTVEHNFTPARKRLIELFETNGYDLVMPYFSKWDAWFVKRA